MSGDDDERRTPTNGGPCPVGPATDVDYCNEVRTFPILCLHRPGVEKATDLPHTQYIPAAYNPPCQATIQGPPKPNPTNAQSTHNPT